MGIAALICGLVSTVTGIATIAVAADGNFRHLDDAAGLLVVTFILAVLGVIFGIIGIVKNAKQKRSLGAPITGLIFAGSVLLGMLIVVMVIAEASSGIRYYYY